MISAGGDCSDGAVCGNGMVCVRDPRLGMVCQVPVEAGKPCTGSSDCAIGSLCVIDPKTKTSTCRRLPGHGEKCDPANGSQCDYYTDYCDPTSNECTPRAAPDGTCPKHAECAWFERCDTHEKCLPKSKVGEACTIDDDCLESLSCVNGSCATLRTRVCSLAP